MRPLAAPVSYRCPFFALRVDGSRLFLVLVLVLVLSETVLVLLLESIMMYEPIFEYERRDAFRLSFDYVTSSCRFDAHSADPEDGEHGGGFIRVRVPQS